MPKGKEYDLACKLSWAAYMTHCLLDGIDLQLSEEEKQRLSQQAQEHEREAVGVMKANWVKEEV